MYYQKVGSKILFTETSKKIPRVWKAGGRFHLCYRWTTYVTARSSLLQTTVRGISIKNSTQTSRIPNCARKSKHWTNTVKPRFTDIRLIRTVFFVPGEKSPHIFSKFNLLNTAGYPVNTDTFYACFRILMKGVWLYYTAYYKHSDLQRRPHL